MFKTPLVLELKGFLHCEALTHQQRDIFLLQMGYHKETRVVKMQNVWLWSVHLQHSPYTQGSGDIAEKGRHKESKDQRTRRAAVKSSGQKRKSTNSHQPWLPAQDLPRPHQSTCRWMMGKGVTRPHLSLNSHRRSQLLRKGESDVL